MLEEKDTQTEKVEASQEIVKNIEEYNQIVEEHIEQGVKCEKAQALDLLKHVLMIRQETGRMYCFNVSRANTHTPFVDVIKLSNL